MKEAKKRRWKGKRQRRGDGRERDRKEEIEVKEAEKRRWKGKRQRRGEGSERDREEERVIGNWVRGEGG